MRENNSQYLSIRSILPIIAANKSTILQQAVYFFKEADFEQTDHLQLLIEVSDEYYGFAAFNTADKKVKAWVLYQVKANTSISETELLHIKNEQTWLNYSYTRTVIFDGDARNVLLPQTLYSEAKHAAQLMFGVRPTDIFLSDEISGSNAVNIYCVSQEMYQLLQANFTNTVWHHKQSLWLQQIPTVDPCIIVSINFHSIFIAAANDRKWILLQRKQYQTPEDVLYHILNCMKHLGFDAEKITVVLEGMAEENSALAALLHQYLYNMKWNTSLEFQYPQEAASIPKHTLALTDRLLSCVL